MAIVERAVNLFDKPGFGALLPVQLDHYPVLI